MRSKITPFLWFDANAEEAVQFYLSVFKDAKIISTARYPEQGQEMHGKPAGSVMTIAFEINGQQFVALNGGPRKRPDFQLAVARFAAGEVAFGGQPSACGPDRALVLGAEALTQPRPAARQVQQGAGDKQGYG